MSHSQGRLRVLNKNISQIWSTNTKITYNPWLKFWISSPKIPTKQRFMLSSWRSFKTGILAPYQICFNSSKRTSKKKHPDQVMNERICKEATIIRVSSGLTDKVQIDNDCQPIYSEYNIFYGFARAQTVILEGKNFEAKLRCRGVHGFLLIQRRQCWHCWMDFWTTRRCNSYITQIISKFIASQE